ncbi:hypothetical protein HB364_18750 [Pseudoflavitalea sp. X16]|uniref:hypothetical protein n=1 Tax=Paraflavitalea devenefica TaxID=2716334 RepID=UPI0014237727|nr:hypothetical protein [Paraflavitalea devenefica]NII27134.1 hypothetical protein [Paraflavitalea devenefica]
MRTSNKILLSLLLTTILLFASLFLAVRVKFANGNMVERKDVVNPWSDEYKIKEEIKSVSISGQMDMVIIPSDSVKIVIGKMGDSLVRYRIKDGVLVIDMDTAKIHPNQNGETVVVFNHIELFLPNVDSIHVANSRLQFRRVMTSAPIKPVYNFELKNTTLTVEQDYRNTSPTFYDSIRINAGPSSEVFFNGHTNIGSASIKLKGAKFDDMDARFDKLSIQADSLSSIKLKGYNLRKATITSTD